LFNLHFKKIKLKKDLIMHFSFALIQILLVEISNLLIENQIHKKIKSFNLKLGKLIIVFPKAQINHLCKCHFL